MKLPYLHLLFAVHCRSSHEERGLKSRGTLLGLQGQTSLLSRGAWIEIDIEAYTDVNVLSLLSRGAWIEID